MLIAEDTNGQRYFSQTVTDKSQKFFCPGCHSPVRLKNGTIMVSHFAHISRKECQYYQENESAEHLNLKAKLYQALASSQTVRVEKHIEAFDQIADLLVGRRLALEVQCSPLPLSRLKERTVSYHKHGYHVLWLLGHKLWLKDRLTRLQRQFLYFSQTIGFYAWELDEQKSLLRLKYMIHEDIKGKVYYLDKCWTLDQLDLDCFRFPYQKKLLESMTYQEDPHILRYIQKQLYYQQAYWLKKQEEAYLKGENLLMQDVSLFSPQCRPPRQMAYYQIVEDLSAYYDDFKDYYEKIPSSNGALKLYPPRFYAIMRARK